MTDISCFLFDICFLPKSSCPTHSHPVMLSSFSSFSSDAVASYCIACWAADHWCGIGSPQTGAVICSILQIYDQY